MRSQRDTAVRELKQWTDSQTPSKLYIDELVCDGERGGPSFYRRYVQGHKMAFEHAGVGLCVSLEGGCIYLQYSATGSPVGEVAMIPKSFQRLALKANLR